MVRKLWMLCCILFVCLVPSLVWAQADLTIDSVTGIQATINPSAQVTARVCVQNQGTASASNFSIALFFSKDDEVTSFDTKLGDVTINLLSSGASTCRTITFQLSQTSAAQALGDNWIAAIVDWDSKIRELNDKNNTSQPIKVRVPGPDLIIDIFSGVPTTPPKPGDTLSLRVCATNNGSKDISSSFEVGVFYSLDSGFSRFDTNLGSFVVNSLGSGAQTCQNVSVKLPANADIGNAYIGAVADFNDKIKEESEDNNTKGVALTPRPDLVIDTITGVPAQAAGGTSMSLRVCIKNVGNADATAFVTGIYYSDNENITTTDTLLADASFTTLAKGQQQCQNVTAKLPAQIFKLGENWVGALADRQLAIREFDETNNTASVKFLNPAPELKVTSLNGMPKEAKPGDSFTVEVCLTNSGATNVTTSFKVFFYHSLDATITQADFKLGEVTYSSLDAGRTVCQNTKVTMPQMPIRNNYLGILVDPGNVVAEEDELNNTFAQLFSNPAPELVIDSIQGVPQTAGDGSTLSVGVCVRNNGSLDVSKSFKVTLYHSVNAEISRLDTKLGEQTIASLAKDQLNCLTFNITLSKSYLAAGDNWIGAILDIDNSIEEFDETNNSSSVKFTKLAPELSITSFQGAPQSAAGGSSFYADVCVKNTGLEDINNKFLVTVYYSTDSAVTQGDTPIGVGTINSLAQGKTTCIVITVTLPANLQRGANYVGSMVDSGEVIQELDENNNFSKIAAILDSTLRIDLQIASVTGLPAQANAGDPLSINVCVKNADTSNATTFKVGLYYSADPVLSIYNDTLLGEVTFTNGVTAGQTVCQTITGKVPSKINQRPQGNWFGVVIDTEQIIPETNKANNISVVRFDDAGGLPDLVIESIKSVPTQGLPKSKFTDIEICVRNVSRGTANPPFNLVMYHSTDKTIDINDHVMATYNFTKPIPSNTAVCHKLTGELPEKVKPGDNWIGAYIDPDEFVTEDKDDNNTKAEKFYIDIADLTVEKIEGVPKTAGPGDSITIKVCIKNKGVKDATAFKLGIYLNPDNNGKSTKIHEVDFPNGLAKGKDSCQSYSFKLPTPLDPGVRALEAKVDFEKKVQEADETNNTKTAEFLVEGPDLTVTSVALTPNSAASGASVSVKVCVKNIGSRDVKDAFVVRIFDSPDEEISNADTKLSEYSYGTADLAKFKVKAAEDCNTVTVTVPSGVTEGRRYFGAFVEAAEKIKEEKEDNNTKTAAFVVPSKTKPNLVAETIKLNVSKQQPGRSLNVEVCVKNFGITIPTSQTIKVGVYLATSKTTVPSLQLHEYPSFQGLESQKGKCLSATIKLPANLQLGEAFLVGWVDFEDNVTEADENDNRIAAAIDIYLDRDDDGVPAGLDCDDRDKLIYPAYFGRPAAKELCDKKDNDCNGQIDESFTNVGQACEAGKGECKVQGKYVCKDDGSAAVCDATPGRPTTEDCNGKDEDCDGKIDNEADAACPGGQYCVEGKCKLILCVTNSHCPTGLICKQSHCQRPKSCQGGTGCDKLESCQAGVCVQKACQIHSDCEVSSFCFGEICVAACTIDIDCGPNHVCDNGRCWKQCVNANDCHDTQTCIRGQCQDKCAKPCQDGERCLLGACVENSCHGYRCPNGQICLKNVCTLDPCGETKCSANEFCTEKRCVKTCSKVTCKPGERCANGVCRKDGCANAGCKDDEICLRGTCHPKTCKDGTCGKDRFCINNKCVDDLCAFVTCPDPKTEVCITDDEGRPQCVAKGSKPPVGEEPKQSEPVVAPEPSSKDAGPEPTPEKAADIQTSLPEPSSPEPDADQGGCSCSSTPPTTFYGSWLLLLLGFLVWRRRQTG